jgi:GTPase KRas protein
MALNLLLHQFYDPTIESSYRQQFMVDDQIAVLDILDTGTLWSFLVVPHSFNNCFSFLLAGQEEYTALQSQWIRSGEGFVLLYSITERSTFDEVERFRTKILNVRNKYYFSTWSSLYFFLVMQPLR